MNKPNINLYLEIRRLWKEAYPSQKKGVSDKSAVVWYGKYKDNPEVVNDKIEELKIKCQLNLSKGNPIMQMIHKAQLKKRKQATPTSSSSDLIPGPSSAQAMNSSPSDLMPGPSSPQTLNSSPSPQLEEGQSSDNDVDLVPTKKPRSWRQDEMKEELEGLNRQLLSLYRARDGGLELSVDQKKNMKTLKKQIDDKKAKIRRLKNQAKCNRNRRAKMKVTVRNLKVDYPEAAEQLEKLSSEKVGRPRLENSQPGLLTAIIDVVSEMGTADEKRRTETVNAVKTLSQLHEQLKDRGYRLSRSGLYLRLLPRDPRTAQGRRHVVTVPVKLARPQNTKRKEHIDQHFAAATIKYLKDLAFLLGPKAVYVISQDDKAKVPLGLPAAKKQAPILMKVEYKVQLPDHDFVVAKGHKLTPSVYAILEINERGVSYSGPTYISIRSGMHDSSTAPRHADDLWRILELPEMKTFCLTEALNNSGVNECEAKPIFIVLTDGGPDEGPRYPKTMKYAALNFKRSNLDALFIATHAPGHSASNPVERRMAPLSRALTGVILPYDTFGTHHNKEKETADLDLEIRNFRKAGELLAELWSDMTVDKHPVIAEFVAPNTNERSMMKSGQETDVTEPSTSETVKDGQNEKSESEHKENDDESDEVMMMGMEMDKDGEEVVLPQIQLGEGDVKRTSNEGKKNDGSHENMERGPLFSTTEGTEVKGTSPSLSTYVNSMSEDEDFQFLTETWINQHVQQSQYLLQIVKCGDPGCCKPARTNLREILKNQFLPPPIPIIQTEAGLKLGDTKEGNFHYFDLPRRLACETVLDGPLKCFDYYLPSAQTRLRDAGYRCGTCEKYFVTKTAAKLHKAVHTSAPVGSAYLIDFENEEDVVEDGIVMIDDISEWLEPSFVPEECNEEGID